MPSIRGPGRALRLSDSIISDSVALKNKTDTGQSVNPPRKWISIQRNVLREETNLLRRRREWADSSEVLTKNQKEES